MCLSLSLTPCGFSSPSTERCERAGVAGVAGPSRRAHRRDILRLVSGADLDLLALVDELTGLLIVPSAVTGWRPTLVLGDELGGLLE